MRTTRFTVAMPRPETHLYEITMEIDPGKTAEPEERSISSSPSGHLVPISFANFRGT